MVMKKMTLSERHGLINEHREALDYEPFFVLTEAEIVAQEALIEANAPYGNDPWGDPSRTD